MWYQQLTAIPQSRSMDAGYKSVRMGFSTKLKMSGSLEVKMAYCDSPSIEQATSNLSL